MGATDKQPHLFPAVTYMPEGVTRNPLAVVPSFRIVLRFCDSLPIHATLSIHGSESN
jgi:hypothetical protein